MLGLKNPLPIGQKLTEHAIWIRAPVRWFVGKRYSRISPQRGVIASPQAVRRSPRVYTTPEPPKHEIPRLTTARYISCFFIDHPPAFFPHQAPSLSPRDISVPTIPTDKGSSSPSNASHSGSTATARKKEERFFGCYCICFSPLSLWVLFFSLLFHKLLYNVHDLTFEKLGSSRFLEKEILDYLTHMLQLFETKWESVTLALYWQCLKVMLSITLR